MTPRGFKAQGCVSSWLCPTAHYPAAIRALPHTRRPPHLWEVSTTDLPSLITLRTQFHRNLRAPGSIPVVGSSCNWAREQAARRHLRPGG